MQYGQTLTMEERDRRGLLTANMDLHPLGQIFHGLLSKTFKKLKLVYIWG